MSGEPENRTAAEEQCKSSAVDHLAKYLKENHHDTSRHVIAIETADLSALTQPEIEAIAKQHMIAVI